MGYFVSWSPRPVAHALVYAPALLPAWPATSEAAHADSRLDRGSPHLPGTVTWMLLLAADTTL